MLGGRISPDRAAFGRHWGRGYRRWVRFQVRTLEGRKEGLGGATSVCHGSTIPVSPDQAQPGTVGKRSSDSPFGLLRNRTLTYGFPTGFITRLYNE